MSKFHLELVALKVSGCGTCSEKFPGLNVKLVSSDPNYTECVHCSRDKHIPKLYSSANHMDPGCVPPPLQVSITACVLISAETLYLCQPISALDTNILSCERPIHKSFKLKIGVGL